MIRNPELKKAIRTGAICGDEKHPTAELIVFIHGYARGPADYNGLIELLRNASGSDIYAVRYDASPFCSESPEAIAKTVLDQIEAAATGYQKLHLCSHSMGCQLLREAILESLTNTKKQTLRTLIEEQNIHITLLAGANRGFQPIKTEQSLGIELVHRWFWLVLMLIVVGWWMRLGIEASESSEESNHFVIATLLKLMAWAKSRLTIVTGTACFLGAVYFKWKRFFAWRGLAIAAMPWIWSEWCVTGEWPWFWAAVVWTGISVGLAAWLLGFGRIPMTAQIVVALGVSLSTNSVLSPYWLWPLTILCLMFAFLYPMSTGLLVEHMLYGSSWITKLRLDWLRRFHSNQNAPPIVHIFGEDDELVAGPDHVELEQCGDIKQIAIKGVKHAYFQLTPRKNIWGQTNRVDEQKYAPIRPVIAKIAGQDRTMLVQNWSTDENPGTRIVPTSKPKSVVHDTNAPRSCIVFIIHGIRDFAEWQQALSRQIRHVAGINGIQIADVVSVRYGYFSAFQFLFSGERERATRVFLDSYAQMMANYPDAICHVAAHSNGTYVVANALHGNQFIYLQNLYLAGSVLMRSFPWDQIGQTPFVSGTIRSDRAASDWPVGVLCWLLGFIAEIPYVGNLSPYRLLGAGGVLGFTKTKNGQPIVYENEFLPGGHGEALHPKYHEEIAKFLLFENVPNPHSATLQPRTGMNRCFLNWILFCVIAGVAVILGMYLLTVAIAGGGLWGVFAGALLTLFVIRCLMAA